jgi:2-dehydro-3-deoxyphosphooctonate aldolase (KDO 8-P synthase)
MNAKISTREISSGKIRIGGSARLLVVAGPDTLESESLALEIARELVRVASRLDITIVFKGSYDKANRSSHESYRGPGLEAGLEILRLVAAETGLPITTDVHTSEEARVAGEFLDMVQVPAFLCRQNDLLIACGETGKIVNIKKGQFLAPTSIDPRVRAATGARTPGVVITERGTSFGHGDLVNDFRCFPWIRERGHPLIYDATHSVQRPGALGDRSGGNRELIPFLARAAAGAGCDGFFFEVHPDPDSALCDGPNSLALDSLEPLLADLIAIDRIARG